MLKTYLIMPFLYTLIIALVSFLKNPIYIRRIAKVFFLIQFIFGYLTFFCLENVKFSFLNINFAPDGFSRFMLLLTSFLFFLFSIISKTFITKLHKVFYLTSFLLLGLVNFSILCDSIFVFLILLFWIFLIVFYFSTSFCNKEEKKIVKFQLKNDLTWLLISTSFLLVGFARYFLLNEIEFDFSNINVNLYKLDDSSINIAFFGFLILIARLFNFMPFVAKNLYLSNKINPLVFSINTLCSLILGCCLFLKCYFNFDYLFYQYQDELSIFLLINFIIFVILAFRQKNLLKFLFSLLIPSLIIGLFSVFSFEEDCINTFSYFSIVLCVSYCLSAFVFMILVNKFKTDELSEFLKIEDKTGLSRIFITASLFNMGCVPFFSFFSAELMSFMMIFSVDYDGMILNIAPYCLVLGALFLSLASFGVLYRILIEPIQKADSQNIFCKHQIFVCSILIFLVIILAFSPEYIFEQINMMVEVEQF
ncbi:MAG: hypothetical protein IJB79_07315 [Candidatus Gastranaerophilales bacterium]|nr:hypothetical protein [Candidatus Gastranaerophilales bacterium]